ncbi:hypothetical protein E3W21_05415 [Pseudomonas sp. F01002]|nr:hypothetical protein E3W21_05415 [Pseudomonas sp. F01002]
MGAAVRRFDLLAKRECQSTFMYLTLRLREQVESSHRRSHIGLSAFLRTAHEPASDHRYRPALQQ